MSQAEFEKATAMVQQMTEEEDQLQLYSLYQQATDGECGSGSPGPGCNMRTKAKWEAWNWRQGMPKDVAMMDFVAIVEEPRKMHGF